MADYDNVNKLSRKQDRHNRNLDNWTVMQPWKILKENCSENKKPLIKTFIKSKSVMEIAEKKKKPVITGAKFKHESLILAQDERWRRA